MRYVVGLICIAVLATFFLIECGDEGGEGGRGGEGGAGPEIATLYGYTYEFDPPLFGVEYPMMVPLKGVRLCQLNTDNCVTSDARGVIKLHIPRTHEETAITMEKEGYGSWVYPNVADDEFPEGGNEQKPNPFPMFTHEQLASVAEQVGTSYPWRGGIVALIRWLSPTPGVKFVAVGPTADEVGNPFYFDVATQQYSLDLEATTNQWGLSEFPLAEGGFTEVTPGVQQFQLAGAAGDCYHVSWGWPGDAPNRIRLPVFEGYTTYGSMRCDNAPPP